MKFTYAYKTSDGVRHEDSIEASSREEVFSTLRAKGIRPIKVVAADGSKANGESVGSRIPRDRDASVGRSPRDRRPLPLAVTIAILILIGLVGLALYPPRLRAFLFSATPPSASTPTNQTQSTKPAPAAQIVYRNAKPLARQMINGDRARIEAAASAFTNAAERFMAAFAEPGRPIAASLAALRPADAEFLAALRTPIHIAETDFTEAVDLKRIVAKIKSDLRVYLSEGGTIDDYLAELVKRQKLEIAHREKAEKHLARLCAATKGAKATDASNADAGVSTSIATAQSTKKKINKAAAYDYWLKANAQLQAMGIYPLPIPDVLRDYEATIDLDEE